MEWCVKLQTSFIYVLFCCIRLLTSSPSIQHTLSAQTRLLIFFRFLALFLLVAIAPLVTSQRRQNKTWPDRTFPGMQQFPSRDELILLVKDLDGYVITPSDSQYANEIKMYNSRVDRFPFAVVMVKSIKDIKAV